MLSQEASGLYIRGPEHNLVRRGAGRHDLVSASPERLWVAKVQRR